MMAENRIVKMAELLKKREEEAARALDKLAEFTPLLFDAIEQLADELNAAGADLVKITRSKGKEPFVFQWGERRLVFIPLEDTARPSSDSNAPVKGQSARIAVFFQNVGDSTGTPVHQFYVFPNGSWASSGIGMPYLEQNFDQHVLLDFAVYFLETVIEGTYRQWDPLKELDFEGVSQRLRNPMGFMISSRD